MENFKDVSKVWYVEGRDFGHELEIHLCSIDVLPVLGATCGFCLLELTPEPGSDPELSGFGAPPFATSLTRTGLGTAAEETLLSSDRGVRFLKPL